MTAFILICTIGIFYIAMTKYGIEEHSILKLKPKNGEILIKKSFRQKLRKKIRQELKSSIEEELKQEILKEHKEYYENKIKKLEFIIENLKNQKTKTIITKENDEEEIRRISSKYEKELKKKSEAIQYLKYEIQSLNEKLNKQKENYKNYLRNKEINIKKGQEYEYKIKCYFENLGYSVYPNGYIKGKNDKGIDLIAYKNNEVHLIQCKCYKNPPKQELIRKFIGDCEIYIKNNQNKLNNKTIYKDFITSCKDKDYGVIKFLEENKNIIDYLIIE
ncbi:restriction endonuclease [Campylobacter sp. RM12637]|uniref:restriction endonuclease n=1 Tax=Campylobacter sp. RM12637 TaxID=2735734 RepID=UPI0030144708|nr:restriction endonuclease [Campylobacter sp. RM12637]